MEGTQLPDGVSAVLDWWLTEVQCCLGGRLHSAVLFGSAVLGDFSPRWSDVDVCVVVNPPLTQPQTQALEGIHDRMRDLFIVQGLESWESSQAVEGSYIPIELVTDEAREMPCFTAGGMTRHWSVGHPISPFDRYMLAHFGCEIAGAHVAFTPPSARALVVQTEHDLAALRNWAASRRSSPWLAGMLH